MVGDAGSTLLHFGVLGPVRVIGIAGPLGIGGVKSQSILAALMLGANRVVPLQRLITAAWDDDPPAGAQTQVRNRISALRRAFREADPSTDTIITSGSGYVLRIPDRHLDLGVFDTGLARARAYRAAGNLPQARDTLAEVLELWRGSALDGLTAPCLLEAAERIEERRISALETRIELDLELGTAAELIPELTQLTVENPYREGLHALLMIALYRAGRQAEAMATFRRIRRELVEQLGVEPGPDIQRLHQALLRSEPVSLPKTPISPTNRASGPFLKLVPRELPAAVPGFAGRRAALEILRQRLPQADSPTTLTLITGAAGVGKTALAVRWAHQAADSFPDGQLYVDLDGHSSSRPMEPIEALGRLLRSVGIPADAVPGDTAEAAARFRSAVSGRRLLIVLDNALSEEQIRPLLPGNKGSVVIATSRDSLAGLVAREGAEEIPLDVFTPREADELLKFLLGEERVDAEADAANELALLCAWVPLTLRMATRSLIRCRGLSIISHVKALRDEGLRELLDAR